MPALTPMSNIYSFSIFLLLVQQADALMHVIAKYVMELSLPEGDMICELPSTVAASALNLTFKLLGKGSWVRGITCCICRKFRLYSAPNA